MEKNGSILDQNFVRNERMSFKETTKYLANVLLYVYPVLVSSNPLFSYRIFEFFINWKLSKIHCKKRILNSDATKVESPEQKGPIIHWILDIRFFITVL